MGGGNAQKTAMSRAKNAAKVLLQMRSMPQVRDRRVVIVLDNLIQHDTITYDAAISASKKADVSACSSAEDTSMYNVAISASEKADVSACSSAKDTITYSAAISANERPDVGFSRSPGDTIAYNAAISASEKADVGACSGAEGTIACNAAAGASEKPDVDIRWVPDDTIRYTAAISDDEKADVRAGGSAEDTITYIAAISFRMKRYSFVRKRQVREIPGEWSRMPATEKLRWEKEAVSNKAKYEEDKYRWQQGGCVGPQPKIPVAAFFLWTRWLVATGRVAPA